MMVSLPLFLSAYGRESGVSFSLGGTEGGLSCSVCGAGSIWSACPVEGCGLEGLMMLSNSPDWPGDCDNDESRKIKIGTL